MATLAFDTLTFAKKLEKAGYTPSQAAGLTYVIAEVTNPSREGMGSLRHSVQDIQLELVRKLDESKAALRKWVLGMALLEVAVITFLVLTLRR